MNLKLIRFDCRWYIWWRTRRKSFHKFILYNCNYISHYWINIMQLYRFRSILTNSLLKLSSNCLFLKQKVHVILYFIWYKEVKLTRISYPSVLFFFELFADTSRLAGFSVFKFSLLVLFKWLPKPIVALLLIESQDFDWDNWLFDFKIDLLRWLDSKSELPWSSSCSVKLTFFLAGIFVFSISLVKTTVNLSECLLANDSESKF